MDEVINYGSECWTNRHMYFIEPRVPVSQYTGYSIRGDKISLVQSIQARDILSPYYKARVLSRGLIVEGVFRPPESNRSLGRDGEEQQI